MLSQRPLKMPTAFREDDRAIFRDMMQLWETEPGQFFKQARLHAVEFAGAPPSNAGAFIPQPTVHAWGHGPRQPNPGPRYFYCKEFNFALNGKLTEIKTPPAVFAGGSPMSFCRLHGSARARARCASSPGVAIHTRRLTSPWCRPTQGRSPSISARCWCPM